MIQEETLYKNDLKRARQEQVEMLTPSRNFLKGVKGALVFLSHKWCQTIEVGCLHPYLFFISPGFEQYT